MPKLNVSLEVVYKAELAPFEVLAHTNTAQAATPTLPVVLPKAVYDCPLSRALPPDERRTQAPANTHKKSTIGTKDDLQILRAVKVPYVEALAIFKQ